MHGQVEQNSHVDVTGKAFYPTTRVNQVRFIITAFMHMPPAKAMTSVLS